MSAQHADVGGLSRAQLRIVTLLDDLNSTVESIEELTRLGEHEKALLIVEDQRQALFTAVDSISHDVCTSPPSIWSRARRHVVALAAAALVAVSSIAMAVGVLGGGESPEPSGTSPERTIGRLARPGAPDARLRVRGMGTGTLPATSVVNGGDGNIGGPLDGLDPHEVDPSGGGLVERAGRVADDASHGRNPAPPQAGENPVETVNGIVRLDPGWGTANA